MVVFVVCVLVVVVCVVFVVADAAVLQQGVS